MNFLNLYVIDLTLLLANSSVEPGPAPDIRFYSRMYELKLTGASDLASLFLHLWCFCLAYRYFLYRLAVYIHRSGDF